MLFPLRRRRPHPYVVLRKIAHPQADALLRTTIKHTSDSPSGPAFGPSPHRPDRHPPLSPSPGCPFPITRATLMIARNPQVRAPTVDRAAHRLIGRPRPHAWACTPRNFRRYPGSAPRWMSTGAGSPPAPRSLLDGQHPFVESPSADRPVGTVHSAQGGPASPSCVPDFLVLSRLDRIGCGAEGCRATVRARPLSGVDTCSTPRWQCRCRPSRPHRRPAAVW